MISDLFLKPLSKTEGYQALVQAVEKNIGKTAAVFGLTEGARTVLAGALSQGRRTLVVTPSDQAALRMAEDLSRSGVSALHFPARELTFYHMAAESRELVHRRIAVLGRLLDEQAQVVCAPIEALLIPLMPVEEFRRGIVKLDAGDVVDLDELSKLLAEMGYVRQETVEARGQFAVRGGILDVYPVQSMTAWRIELFDDEVDSVRELDVMTQRSQPADEACVIYPATEAAADGNALLRAACALEAEVKNSGPVQRTPESEVPWLTDEENEAEDAAPADGAVIRRSSDGSARSNTIDALKLGHRPEGLENLIPYLYEKPAFFSDYFDPELVVLDEAGRLRERAVNMGLEFAAKLENALERQEGFPGQSALMDSWDGFIRILEKRRSVTMGLLAVGIPDLKLCASVTIETRQAPDFQGQTALLAEQLRDYARRGYAVAMLSGGQARGERLVETLREKGISVSFREEAHPLAPGEMAVMPLGLTRGFELKDADFAVLGDTDLFGTTRQRAARRRHKAGEKIQAFTELKVGDYVVHESYGIGIYTGTERMTAEGKTRDYLHIQYQGGDSLYVPTDNLSRVQKYIGMENKPPKLSRLGGAEWARSKSRAKHEILEMADELIKLYAARQAAPGYAFSADTPWQRDFEDDFPYEETPDQLQCIEEIKQDMQQPHPMDRLLCGDVGYGKTEVAVRAAFKAVMDSKQVAFLVPTTVLAQQHYQSVKKRFAHFPVRIEMLSRFRTAQEQKHILQQLKEGKIDILIGTHRLLGKDVHFKDLGLLVVDEEQRFGVGHKETLKEISKNVDVLTLSATPIPRTLNMALSGIRDMSSIEEPPMNRHPVQTFVLEQNDGVLLDAIRRELSRGGQVYYLHNRVESIERCAGMWQQRLPDARIGIVHGKMGQKEIAKVMNEMADGEIDILVCTTIIETGIDIPNANTLIIENADSMGLAQLHQIRGRVGRSSRHAYAYLCYRHGKALSEIAQKRLSAIREYAAFGSGFKIAMRDLEIRGAGNVLGPEQSGHMMSVGYDLYLKLLEEAVQEEKGETPKPRVDCAAELLLSANLPSDYVPDAGQRIDLYRRIALIRTEEQRSDMLDELIDRFGEPPEEATALLDIALLRSQASEKGIAEIKQQDGRLLLTFAETDFVRLSALCGDAAFKGRLLLNAGSSPYLSLRLEKTEKAMDMARLLVDRYGAAAG